MGSAKTNKYHLYIGGERQEVEAVSVEVTETAIFGTDGEGDITFAAPLAASVLVEIKETE